MKPNVKNINYHVFVCLVAFLLTLVTSWDVFGQKTPGYHGFATATITTTVEGKTQKVKVVSKTFGYYTERVNSAEFEKKIKQSLTQVMKEKYGESFEITDYKVISGFSIKSIEKKHKVALTDKNFTQIVEFTPTLADALPGTFVCPLRK